MSGYPAWNGVSGGEGFYEDDDGKAILCRCCPNVAQSCTENGVGSGDWQYFCSHECEFSKPGKLFDINRADGSVRLAGQRITGPVTAKDLVEGARRISAQSVHPGDAHWTDSYCPETGVPQVECRCTYCAGPTTMPTEFPAAPAAPEICHEDYYGTPCLHMACKKPHRLPRRKP